MNWLHKQNEEKGKKKEEFSLELKTIDNCLLSTSESENEEDNANVYHILRALCTPCPVSCVNTDDALFSTSGERKEKGKKIHSSDASENYKNQRSRGALLFTPQCVINVMQKTFHLLLFNFIYDVLLA